MDGLNATFAASVNTTGVLVPPEVFTTRFPVAAPAGTVVTMSVLLQSPALAMVAVSGPPDAFEKRTTPALPPAPRGHEGRACPPSPAGCSVSGLVR